MIDFILSDTTTYAMLKGLQQVNKLAEKDIFKNYVVIVPDSKTIMAESYLLQHSNTGAFANVYIYSLKRLLNKISPVNSNIVLTKQASTMIVRKVIIENLDRLICYKKTANSTGFAEVMYSTIAQLKSSDVTVADFYSMIENVSASLKIKMQDIALIFEKYQDFIENRYLDQSDLLTVLKESAQSSEFIKQSHFYYLGFESVTAEALQALIPIIKSCKSFTVSASYNYGTANNHIFDNEVFTKFKAVADSFKFNYVPKRYNQPFKVDFLHIKNNLYTYPAKIKNSCNSIEILNAKNIIDEVDFVAQKISLLIKSGVRYKNIAVIVNGLEQYAQTIDTIFSQYQFSYFLSKPYDYKNHPLFNLIKSYLRIIRKNYEVSDVIEFLSNILINTTPYLEDFINYVNKYGINHLKFCKQFKVYDDKVITKEQFIGIESLRQALVSKVGYFNVELSTTKDYVVAIKNMLQSININERLQKLQLDQSQDKVQQNITSQALGKLDLVLNQLTTFLADEKIDIAMLESLLLGGLSVTDVSVVPVSQDSIIVSNSSDGFYDIDYVFILNCSEGNFPIKQQDCGIIADSEINQLSDFSKKTIEPTIKTINRRERFKAYETLLLANKKVYLSYCLGTGENVIKRSNIIDQLINMFAGSKEVIEQNYLGEFGGLEKDSLLIIKNKLVNKNKVIKYVCTEIGNKKLYDNYNNIKLVSAAYSASADFMSINLASYIRNINSTQSYFVKDAPKLLFKDNKTSTSQLEKYFTCPFLFFANYGLRLKENESSKLRAIDVGNILHRLAELFVDKFIKNTHLNVELTAKNAINYILSNQYVLEDNKFLVKIIIDEGIRLCQKLADEILHSHFKPIALEQGFGKNCKIPAVDFGNVKLEGKIDRIDVCNKRFRIIDYKTGKIEDNIKRIYYGKKIQLVTYLLALQSSGLSPAGVVYFPIRNEFNSTSSKMKGFFINDASIIMDMDTTLSVEKLSSDVLDIKLNKPKNNEFTLRASANLLTDDQFSAISEYVKSLITKAIDEILEGDYLPSPIRLSESDNLPCEHCPYLGVCGVENTQYKLGRKCYTNIKLQDIKGDNNE